eukprot:CAMPEP_0181225002 /NCGR_PEP_ID=MMETSP1096-20121128/31446_1 /TAXON_ID=156174 ORGANISM="Chrysochromulina ericina, Strain CCMP281" /NCGR_SAMPLE_ID=MMETSP1096 /ASSEMBLY_ACC=CAM_ASM_000453 /LENGTH=272 /DNA_ID=CAMNT_0023318159 /DNA_START=25 /DNA_END=843 /DNA_ORIENTATION=-
MESTLTQDQMREWGWRVPFCVALPLGVGVLFLQQHMPEPGGFSKGKATAQQIVSSGCRRYKWQLIIASCLCSLHCALHYGVVNFVKHFLVNREIQPISTAAWIYAIGMVATFCSEIACGHLCDKLGFFTVAMWIVPLFLVVFYPAWALLVATGLGSWNAFVTAILFGLLSGQVIPCIGIALGLFPMHVRVTLFGLAYNLVQLLFGATAPIVENALVDTMQNALSSTWAASTFAGLWPTLAGLITLGGLWFYKREVQLGSMAPTSTGREEIGQ